MLVCLQFESIGQRKTPRRQAWDSTGAMYFRASGYPGRDQDTGPGVSLRNTASSRLAITAVVPLTLFGKVMIEPGFAGVTRPTGPNQIGGVSSAVQVTNRPSLGGESARAALYVTSTRGDETLEARTAQRTVVTQLDDHANSASGADRYRTSTGSARASLAE